MNRFKSSGSIPQSFAVVGSLIAACLPQMSNAQKLLRPTILQRTALPFFAIGWCPGSRWIVAIAWLQVAMGLNKGAADEIAQVRTKLVSEPAAWVGQQVRFDIELMSSTFFSGSANFDLPKVSGLVLVKSNGSPVVASETNGGETWSIQRHSFSAYAHRPGEFVIPAFPVRFSVAAAFGQPPLEQRFETQTIKFEVNLPPGAEGLSLLISTGHLKVEETWKPEIPTKGVLELDVGDAITRTILLRASDVPGMALPSIPLSAPDGISVYPGQPAVTDREARGDHTGERVDSTTFVCEQAGEFSLPAIAITWWNTSTNTLERETLPPVQVIVSRNKQNEILAITTEPAATRVPERWRTALISVFVLLASGFVVWRLRDRVHRWLTATRTRRAASESVLFSGIRSACNRNDPVAALNALMRWLENDSPGMQVVTLEAFARKHDNPQLKQELDLLQHAVILPTQSWSGIRLAKELIKVRKRKNKPVSRSREFCLPPLNPAQRDC